MKLKTQELIRSVELGSYIGVFLLSLILSENVNNEQVNEVLSFLESKQIDINQIQSVILDIYMLDYFTSFRTQTFSSEYKELKELYKEIVVNTSKFYKQFGMVDPISIFATYVYMYRRGYFSYENQFMYSNDIKDFAKLGGIDVVRGRGVCRSIASMLTDIYNEMGMTSYNLTVKTSSEQVDCFKKLSPIELELESGSEKLVKFVELFTKIIPISNHLITMVKSNGKNYIFDPTNDGFLINYNNRLLQISEIENCYMKNNSFGLSNLMLNILGQYSYGINILAKQKQISLPTVSFEKYEEIYLQALKLCQDNKELFEGFYQNNRYFIDQIYFISENQSGMIKRLMPIIPNKKK